VEFFPTQAKTPNITTTDEAIMAAEVLTKALNNPTLFNHTETLRDKANNTLITLSKVYAMKKEMASPRVAEPPRVAPVPRVMRKTAETDDQPISARTRSATAAAASISPENLFLHQCWANSVAHPITGAAMEYHQLISDPATREA
jgi:hypothetical protein